MIVVDSSVWIANLRDQDHPAVRFLDSADDRNSLILGDIILLEVLQGARDESHALRLERYLRRFRIDPMLDEVTAIRAAQHYRELRRSGITLTKPADLIIAAFCIAHGHSLLHVDRDFDLIARSLPLRIVDPHAPSR